MGTSSIITPEKLPPRIVAGGCEHHFVRVKRTNPSPRAFIDRLTRRYGWRIGLRSGPRPGEEGEAVPVEPNRPNKPLQGGAAAPLEFDDRI